MYKSESKPPFRGPPPQQQSVPPHMVTHEPARVPDDVEINQLFSVVQEGDSTKIIKYISENNSAVGLRDTEGRTALHIVLNNDFVTMTDQQRYDLVKFLINHGVAINAMDKNNVTALHLAVKFQDYKIAKLLIDRGADVMATDNQGMNALHYLTQGKIESCENPKEVKDIVPAPEKEEKEVQKREPPQKELKELTKHIIELLGTDEFNKFIKSSKRTIQDIENVYPQFALDQKNQFTNELLEIAKDTSKTDEEKQELVRNKISAISKGVAEHLTKEKLKEALKNVDYSEPVDDPNTILKKSSQEQIIEINNQFINKEQDSILFKILDDFTSLVGTLQIMKQNINNIYENFSEIEYINSFSKRNNFIINRDRPLLGRWDLGINHIDLQTLFMHPTLRPEVNKNELNMSGPIVDDLLVNEKSKNPIISRGTKTQIEIWKRTGVKKVQPVPLTIDPTPILGPNIDIETLGPEIPKPPSLQNPNYRNLPVFFLAKYVYAIRRMEYHKDVIEFNLDGILGDDGYMQTGYTYEIMQKVNSSILISIINSIQNIVFAFEDKHVVFDKIGELGNEINKIYNSGKDYPYIFAWEYAQDVVQQISTTFAQLEANMIKYYKNLLVLQDDLNKIVDIINTLSGLKIMKSYFDTPFNDPNTGSNSEYFDRNFLFFKKLPESYDEYRQIYRVYRDLPTLRQKLYNAFIPTVNKYSYAKYYFSNIKDKSVGSTEINYSKIRKSHFANSTTIEDIEDGTNGTYDQTFNRFPIADRNSTVGYLVDFYVFDNNDNQDMRSRVNPEISFGSAPPLPSDLQPARGNNIGTLGLSVTERPPIDRSLALEPAIGDVLNNHLFILKNMLIEQILTVFNTTGLPQSQLLQDLIDRTKSSFNIDDNQARRTALTIIAQISDTLILDHYKYSIQSASNSLARKIVNGVATTDSQFARILQAVTTSPREKEPILRVDTGFALNLQKLFDEILYPFTTSIVAPDSKKFRALQFTEVTVREPEDKQNQYPIHSFNYSQPFKITEEDCYIIDDRIIDLLGTRLDLLNARDISGYTPLNYAVNTLHTGVIKKLVQKGAEVARTRVASRSGVTPLGQANELYQQHLSFIYDHNSPANLNKFYKPILETMIKDLELNYKNNVMRYIDIIFPMLLNLYNQMFYIYYQKYLNNWSREDRQAFENLLVQLNIVPKIEVAEVPLLNISDFRSVRHAISTDPLSRKSEQLDKTHMNDALQISRLQHQIDNLQKEIDELRNRATTDWKIQRYVNRLVAEQGNLRAEIARFTAKTTSTGVEISNVYQNLETKTAQITQDLITRTNNFIGSDKHLNVNSVTDLYQNVFDYVVNDNSIGRPIQYTGYEDFNLYQEIWTKYLESENLMLNVANLHFVAVVLQTKLAEMMTQNQWSIVAPHLNLVNKLYDNILLPVVDDYRLLPKELNKQVNYVLTDVFDIMVHVVRYTICANMYQSVIKAITKYFMAINPKEIERMGRGDIMMMYGDEKNYSDLIRKLVKRVVDFSLPAPTVIAVPPTPPAPGTVPPPVAPPAPRVAPTVAKNPDPRLERYIVFDMPKLLVKYQLQLFVDDVDPHRKISAIDQIFQPIIELLMNNPAIKIPEDSSLIVNLKSNIFKYYNEIISTVIPMMQIILDNYNRYIINDSRLVDIMQTMTQKATTETN